MKRSLTSAIALLILASASLVEAQTLQTLCSFNWSFNNTNGAYPNAALTPGNDGSFYGTTSEGGSLDEGTIFQMTTNGTLTTLVSFNNTNGASPYAALTLGNDGNFYGTTWGDGSSDDGTVFQMTTNGRLTTLVSFNKTNGANPDAALTLGTDGNFYGTTWGDGSSDEGTAFQVTTNGRLTTLVSFNNTNGASPAAALTPGTDGNFYGMTMQGGSYGMGTAFQMTTNGTLTTLVSFNNTNGASPAAALTLGTDGNFYGTTATGGTSDEGTVFRLSLAPVISVQPRSQTNWAGETVRFLVSEPPLNPTIYQWQKDGIVLVNCGNVSGATTSTLTISSISDNDTGSYSVIVTNSFGSAISSNAVLTVNDFLFIASQPQGQTVGLGSNVTLNATVYGAPPFVFQWYFNDSPVGSPSTGTNVSYTLTSVETNQAGNYSVFVVNGYGSLMSSNAVLTVKVFPPSIGLQPSSQSVMIGSSASFNVSVSGTAPIRYQWRFNGTNLPNATNAAYAIQSVGATDTGNYSVVVTNLAGSVKSSNALLTVIVPPTLALEFLAGYPLLNLNGMKAVQHKSWVNFEFSTNSLD